MSAEHCGSSAGALCLIRTDLMLRGLDPQLNTSSKHRTLMQGRNHHQLGGHGFAVRSVGLSGF